MMALSACRVSRKRNLIVYSQWEYWLTDMLTESRNNQLSNSDTNVDTLQEMDMYLKMNYNQKHTGNCCEAEL